MEGRRIATDTDYFWFRGRDVHEVSSMKLNGGQTIYQFALNDDAEPKQILCSYGKSPHVRVMRRGVYRVQRDELEIYYGWQDTIPGRLDANQTDVMFYKCRRDGTRRPQVKAVTNAPPIIDSLLGTLYWDDELNEYEGELELAGEEVRFIVEPWREGGIDGALAKARAVRADFEGLERQVRGYAERELLPLKNGGWLNENETPLTAAEFQRRLRLERIQISSFQYLSFLYDADEMFADHDVEITLNPQCEFHDASLSG